MIRKLIVTVALAFVTLAPAAAAQSPAPSPPAGTATPSVATTPPAEDVAVADEPGDAKPWIRLTWLVPLAIVFGAGSVLGRRLLIERGWLDAA
jgi:hypothetical protein